MSLSSREERYARLLVEGLSQSAAFRTAYPHSKRWKPEAVHSNASNLARKVSARVKEMQDEAKERSLLTLEEHMRELEDLRNKAKETENWAPAIAAEVKRGELMGYYVNRSESTNTNYNISDKPMDEEQWACEYAESIH